MYFKKEILTLATLIIPAHAQDILTDSVSNDSRFGLGLQAGTLGIGGHVTYEVSPWFYLKGEISGFGLDLDEEIDDIDYGGDLDLFSTGLTANFRPFHNNSFGRIFRVTAGAYFVDLDFDATPNGGTVELEDTIYNIGGDDSLKGSFSIDSLSPYLGLGLDFGFGAERNFILSLDLGVLFVGSPDVDLSGTGAFAAGGGAFADVQSELLSLQEDADDYEFYPLLQIAATYRF